jgi:hypothetical protein
MMTRAMSKTVTQGQECPIALTPLLKLPPYDILAPRYSLHLRD